MVPPKSPTNSLGESSDGFEKILQQFDQARRSKPLARLEDYLPPISGHVGGAVDPARRKLLEELVKIDLECSWKQAAQRGGSCLEDYIKRYPELGPVDLLPLELIGWEYRVRHRWGDHPSHQEYLKRFPRGKADLPKILARIDAELAAEFARKAGVADVGEQAAVLPASKLASSNVEAPRMEQPISTIASLMETLRQMHLLTGEQLKEVKAGHLAERSAEPRA